MDNFLLQKTKLLLLKKIKMLPQIAIITGSGIKLFYDFKPLFQIKYNHMPFLENANKSTVIGHEGKLKLYKIKDKTILVFSGRRHLYEGLSFTKVVSNVKLAYELGVRKLIITNAAGGINKKFKVGDLMLITGFINLMQPTERGVLDRITQKPYKIKTKLNSLLTAYSLQLKLRTGIYAAFCGPSYETYSEIKFLQSLGTSAIGMSTIPEMISAKSLGVDFAGISIISNVWHSQHKPSHKEVVNQVSKANKKLDNLILRLLVDL